MPVSVVLQADKRSAFLEDKEPAARRTRGVPEEERVSELVTEGESSEFEPKIFLKVLLKLCSYYLLLKNDNMNSFHKKKSNKNLLLPFG